MRFLFESSVCLALFVILYEVLLRNEPAYLKNRWYLLSTMFISVVIPFISIPVYAAEILTPANGSGTQTTGAVATWSNAVVILWIYLAGVVLMCLRSLIKLANVFKLIATLNKRTPIKLKSAQPFSFFNRAYISDDITGEARNIILTHEKVHMHYGHSYDLLIVEIVSIIFWFHPAVYLLKKYLREVHEYAADSITCERLQLSMSTYLDLVHHIAIRPGMESPHVNTFSSFIKKRILMLTTTTKDNTWRYLLALPLILLMLVMFSFCSAQDKTAPVLKSDAPRYIIDTVIVFDPNTYEEQVIIYQTPADMKLPGAEGPFSTELKNDAREYSLDTVIVYDPDTKKEKMTRIMVVKKKE